MMASWRHCQTNQDLVQGAVNERGEGHSAIEQEAPVSRTERGYDCQRNRVNQIGKWLPHCFDSTPVPSAHNNNNCGLLADVKQNGLAVGFDIAGIAAGFTPGGDAAVALAQIAVGVGAVSNSGATQDNTGLGLGVAGITTALFTPAARATGTLARAIPGAGAIIAGASALHDLKAFYDGYKSCGIGG
jgi:hypothetical protein